LKTRKLILACTLAITLIAGALVTIRIWPRPALSARIPSSVAVLDDKGRLLRLTVASDQQYRLWTPLDEVSPEFVAALMLHEDRHYYWHPGVNPASLVRAAIATYTGGTRQGGSTLTMQLARLLYGLNTRSAAGKMRQIGLAIGLQMRYSKRDLLEAHLNLIPFGSNLQGVGAASLIYFGKQPARLSLNEALTLVLVPQAPTSRNPRSEEPVKLTSARLRLFAQWLAAHPGARDQSEAMRSPLQYKGPRSLPFEAPHFTTAMLSQSTAGGIIPTTLDLHQQQTVERVLQAYVREQARMGIRNAAALLVDSRDLGVRAAVGSARFADESISGQVNGTLAKRSPGSALKPFVYALAMDQGLIHPLTVLKDAPTAFGTFSPENFDGRFVGPISATEALIRSRNVPAVALSSRLAQPSFYEFLRSAGISQLASERHYGLALALGGGEVTLEETAMLYAMVANHGLLRPLRHRTDEPTAVGTRLLSEEASFMTVDMLQQNPRPEDSGVQLSGRLPVAWKTGTSWGFRDAWTAGLFGHYVLVVWVGNFDGSSNPAFVGAQAAAPLFFRIIDALHAAEPDIAEISLRPPAGVSRIEVCAASGDLPNADCPQTATTWYIPGKSPIRVSEIHRRIWFDTRTGRQACPPYDARFVRSEVFEMWSSDMLRLFAQAGMPRRQPPALSDCRRGIPGGHAPSINSPLRDATYTLRASRVGSEAIPLAATTDGSVRSLHWFVDDAYVGTTRPDATVSWIPGRSGVFLVRAIDDQGRADSRRLAVAVVP
jgi:penicillin-binding protein 1C